MTIDIYPLDIQDSDDSEVAELTADEAERARTLKSSLSWYRRQNERSGGWTRAIEQCEEELEELCGSSDIDELDELLGEDDEYAELDDTERAIAECKERIEWYERHDYGDVIEKEYDRLKRLKEGA